MARHISRNSYGNDGIVIAGGGLAGQRCAETLRRSEYDGPIRILCSEKHRPYDRPPLSKELLISTYVAEAPSYRPAEWYDAKSIDLLLGIGARALVPGERKLGLTDGSELRYERLLIATGSAPRQLPQLARYENVSTLRTVEDCAQLRDALHAGARLAIIGAGFIGQEVASAARELGVEVTLIEAAEAPMLRLLGAQIGSWFSDLHRAEGVSVRTGCELAGVNGARLARRLHLSDGSAIDVDHVVVGIGVAPNTGWLNDSGLDWTAGIPADPFGRTAVEHVLAAGDAAATFDAGLGRHAPGSHWEAAARQGARAARMMLGLDAGRSATPSFWSDIYGIRIQYLGQAQLADEVRIDGAPDLRDFAAFFTRSGRAVAALLVDRPRSLPAARALLEEEQDGLPD